MTPPQGAAIVVSPHLDDVVFSCPGWVRERAREGVRPTIVTLFSHAPESASADKSRLYELRRKEDEEATALVGASQQLAGFFDAPFRSKTYGSLSGIVCGHDPDDDALLERVTDYLTEVVNAASPQRVVGPLAVGTHIDHRIAHQACVRLQERFRDVEFSFYEDRPYAFVDESVRLRLAELGKTALDPDFDDRNVALRSERFFLGMFAAPYVRQHLHALDQGTVVAHHQSIFARTLNVTLRPVRSTILSWSADIMRDLTPALEAYSSQTRGFLGSPLYHQWASLEYARRLGCRGRYLERFWHL